MRKLLISATLTGVLGLVGCSGETIDDVAGQREVIRPASRMVFDPAAGVLPLPTDLLLGVVRQTTDGTLEVPKEVAQSQGGARPDYTDAEVVLGALAGWSTQSPFSLQTTHPEGISLQASSLNAPGAVRLFKGNIGGDISDADCATVTPLAGCKIQQELTFGVDFVTKASGNDIAIVPLKPLQTASTYYVVVTDKLKGSDGLAVKASTSYELLRRDIQTLPLATASQLTLQRLINSYESVLVDQGGVAKDSIIYSGTFTTQAADTIYQSVKFTQIAKFAQAVDAGMSVQQAAQFLPVIPVNEGAQPSAFEVLAPTLNIGFNNCNDLIAAATAPSASDVVKAAGSLCAAELKQGSIDLPYYLSPTKPLTESWTAACTNGLAIQTIGADKIPALIQSNTISAGPNNDFCQAVTNNQLFDLDLTKLGITDYRHVSRFSPIPLAKGANADGTETLDVQITVPDISVVKSITGVDLVKPANGWPVVMLGHGITSKKEDFLAISGALSLAGFATVAIDHPLHGSRGFRLADNTIVNASSGFGGATTDYFNLASLLSARDNLRQGIVDQLGLRLGLHALVDNTGGTVDLDSNNVFFVGQSLGSIIGSAAVNMANSSLQQLDPALAAFDSLYSIKAASLAVPGGGIAQFLIESPSFGALVKGSVLAGVSAEFQQFIVQYAKENSLSASAAIEPAYTAFATQMSAEQQAQANAAFRQFAFIAQTVLDPADANNLLTAMITTPVLMMEQVGGGKNDDGSTALPDQVIPNTTSIPTSGTEPLAAYMGLAGVSSSGAERGLVRFLAGVHSSLLKPSSLLNPNYSTATTLEQQRQVASYFSTTLQGKPTIKISNENVVKN